MPELPEVETVCRGLAQVLPGRRLTAVEVRRPDLRIPFPENFAARLEGRRVEGIRRRAKYLLIDFDDKTVLISHLGMSGRLYLGTGPLPEPGVHDHVRALTDDGGWFVYNDHRRFGLMTLDCLATVADHPLLRDLGPEPLGNTFDAACLSTAIEGRRSPIKTVLLDQTVVAGLGNIYVCEALHRAGIAPTREARTVAGKSATRLVPAIRDVLAEAIEAGGSTLRDYVQANGELGYFQKQFAVYGREGEDCPKCAAPPRSVVSPVQRIVQSNRSTFFCRKCQR